MGRTGPIRLRPCLSEATAISKNLLEYRRDDGEAHAGRVHEALAQRWGYDDVFMDQFSLVPGEVFSFALQQAAAHADVMVVLVGPHWRTRADPQGRPRIDDERDYVRREIVTALDRGTVVCPVLLPGAGIPVFENWYDPLRHLRDVQFHSISSARNWRYDIEVLVGAVAAVVGSPTGPGATTTPPSPS